MVRTTFCISPHGSIPAVFHVITHPLYLEVQGNHRLTDISQINLRCACIGMELSRPDKDLARILLEHVGLSENSVPHCTQWFCWSLSLLNGYFIGNINPTFSVTNPCWDFKLQAAPSRRVSCLTSFCCSTCLDVTVEEFQAKSVANHPNMFGYSNLGQVSKVLFH